VICYISSDASRRIVERKILRTPRSRAEAIPRLGDRGLHLYSDGEIRRSVTGGRGGQVDGLRTGRNRARPRCRQIIDAVVRHAVDDLEVQVITGPGDGDTVCQIT